MQVTMTMEEYVALKKYKEATKKVKLLLGDVYPTSKHDNTPMIEGFGMSEDSIRAMNPNEIYELLFKIKNIVR